MAGVDPQTPRVPRADARVPNLMSTAPSTAGQPVPHISVVFPCHNEAENVAAVIADAQQHVGALGDDYELIIVDDGSSDGTAERAREAAAGDDRVRVAQHPTNLGYGHALRTGFAAARAPLICYVDGDGQFSLADLPTLLDALGTHGFVLGYRIQRADPAHRTLNARLWGLVVRLVMGFNVRDIDCGFKLFRREVVQDIEFIAGRGAVISAELVARATHAGHTYTEVGVTHYPRTAGEQSGNSPLVVLNSFVDIARLRWRLR